MRLSLICHASTRALRQARFALDEPIDAIGSAKATALAGLLPPAAQVWSSTALRSVQTAAALGLEARVQALLDDCDYGRWGGRSLAQLQAEQPQAVLDWLTDPAAAPHGGESLLRLQERVVHWMAGLDQQVSHIVAVSHPSVIRLAILHALGAGIDSFWRIDLNPLSLTDLRFSNQRWTLRAAGVEVTGDATIATGTDRLA